MKLTEQSLKAIDSRPYDQAVEIYETKSRRRKSRFMKDGKVAGLLCIASSRRYPGQFTDRIEGEAKMELSKYGKTSIFIFDKRVWEIKPPGTYSNKNFKVFIGDNLRPPRIVSDKSSGDLVIEVPEDFRREFERDIHAALSDIASISTSVVNPFISNKEIITKAFGEVKSILSRECCDFKTTEIQFYPKRFSCLEQPRFVHIDLALNTDSAGLACGYVPSFTKVQLGGDVFEIMPRIIFDFVLEIPPPIGEEINFEKIRTLIYKLHKCGLPIEWVSMDSYQSVDTIQLLRQQGFTTGQCSPDKKPLIYDVLKGAILDKRVFLPPHEKALKELVTLERNTKTGKIDHPPWGSKDLADAIAGVVFGLTMRREVWNQHEIPPYSIPESLTRGYAFPREQQTAV